MRRAIPPIELGLVRGLPRHGGARGVARAAAGKSERSHSAAAIGERRSDEHPTVGQQDVWRVRRARNAHPAAQVVELILLLAEIGGVCALNAGIEVGPPLRGPYIYRWYLNESLRPSEEDLIARGELPAVGARVVARRR